MSEVLGDAVAEDVRGATSVDGDDIDGSCVRHASQYAYHVYQASLERVELDALVGRLDLQYRRNPPEGVKVTESVISSLIKQDPEFVAAETKALRYRAIVEAMMHRRDMLKILGALRCREMLPEPKG